MLRSVQLISVAAVLAVAPSLVLAEEATGTIKTINATTRQVTLDDGKIYAALGSIDLAKLKAGDKVKVTYDAASPVFASLGVFGSATKIAAAN